MSRISTALIKSATSKQSLLIQLVVHTGLCTFLICLFIQWLKIRGLTVTGVAKHIKTG